MPIRRAVAAASIALIAVLSATSAQAYDRVVVFGDSLSDNGNLAQKFGGAVPGAPYVNGRFSNGPVAVEVMATQLGLPLVDYAYGGALTGTGNQFQAQNPLVANTGLLSQVNNFAAQGPADAQSLYVVWGGGNDFLATINGGNFSNISGVVTTAVTNLVTEVGTLYGAGARDFLVPLLPDLATTFYGTSGALPAPLLTSLSTSFNAALNTQLNKLQAVSPGMNLTIFDTPTLLAGVRAGIAASGGDVVDRCWTGDYTGANNSAPLCANPDQYYLFDKVHPTAFVHDAVGHALAAAVPEPTSSGLMTVGLVFTGLALRRRRMG
ncbi:MAG: PEP-CTERM sorting domain-containing protein [Burkholderiales bacterium]|jgi:phospholipase/lecithinase/hemolysin|nr:MAG: PEP-CTERM sorting domain-containing protein [Burkholderiales bacterium]